ncbi:MAG: type VII secretion protein EssC [Clostridium sp.]|nr:type VII secretion protein EssC [Clostridium sp.]
MSVTKEESGRACVILLIFSKYACVRKHLPNLAGERRKLRLFPEEAGLAGEVEIELMSDNGIWRVGGRELSDKFPCYHYTERNEKLLLLLSEKKCLRPVEMISLEEGDGLKIGSSFRNQIFFECFSLVKDIHVEIQRGKQGYIIENSGLEGIYLNEKALSGMSGRGIIKSGDRVDIYGLHLLFLKEIIVCTAFCGICRAAGQRKITHGILQKTPEIRGKNWIERKCMPEEELHTGEIELLLPEKLSPERRQPLILTMGPALTMVLPMLLMAQVMNRYMEDAGGFYYASVLMSICSALLTLFWGLAGYGHEKYTGKRGQQERERQYREYLRARKEELLQCQTDNRRILEKRYPTISFILGEEKERPSVFWNRYYRQEDFLFFRFGTGETPFQVKIKLSEPSKSIVPERLAEEAREMAEGFKYLKEAPIGVNFYENRQIGMVGDMAGEGLFEVLLGLCVQIAACHCYTEVKLVCFYQEERRFDRRIADCLRWMRHSRSRDGRTRFLAGNEREAGEILPALTGEIMREEGKQPSEATIPWYIVLILNEELILGEPFYHCLTQPDGIYPLSAVFVGKKREEIPKSCRCFISAEELAGKSKYRGELLKLRQKNIERQAILLEGCGFFTAQSYLRRTAGFQVQDTETEGRLPQKADFLQLYGCSMVEELDSLRRWETARTEERMKVPLGLGAGGRIVSLDVHEKFHGPHGLIAGTTGSGKSELLQTYLLSIAVNFSPEDVNFFMIDYKGGGTGNLLKGLPHCAGVISNLSGKQIKRAMSAIASENRRRQKLFNDFQVNHIDGYTKLCREGKASYAIPHLLLVVDEFAELKKEEPEFMQEIVSLAQVGRSLGVHLILATQKPAGTVDDKIWSNARFRLCLRVQDRQDSLDMLHSGDAAMLTAPGQCYLQIGNHEYYELFQAGYCGGIYRREGERKAKAALLSTTGKRLEKAEDFAEEGGESQMEAALDYIKRTAENSRYRPAPQLWLPELPAKILLAELKKEEKVIVIGLCDDPENQRHFPLAYKPVRQGHLAVCGGPGSGKTTFLQTILWQLCKNFLPEEVLFLAVDIRQEGLIGFNAMPHCLGILREKEGGDVFFYQLENLINGRRKQLSGIGWEQYNHSGKEKLPLIFLAIDNCGLLKKILSEEQEGLIMKLAAEGIALGIYLLLSASGTGEIGGKLYEKIRTGFALEMSDRFQYGDVLRQYYIPVLPEENKKGRGLCKVEGRVLEFQTALFAEEQTGYGGAEVLERMRKELNAEMEERRGRLSAEEKEKREKLNAEAERKGRTVYRKFLEVPKEPSFEKLAEDFKWKGAELPLGYCLSTGEICAVSLENTPCFLISGGAKTGKATLLSSLIEGILRLKHSVVILDTGKRLINFKERTGVIYLENEEEMESWRERQKESGQRTGVFISDIGCFCKFLYRSGPAREERVRFWEKAAAGGEIDFLAGVYHSDRDYEAAGYEFFRRFTAGRQGIHLGGNAAGQRIFSFDDLSYTRQSQPEPAGIGYYREKIGGGTRRLLLPAYEEGEKK